MFSSSLSLSVLESLLVSELSLPLASSRISSDSSFIDEDLSSLSRGFLFSCLLAISLV
jgi:hypothetical protein